MRLRAPLTGCRRMPSSSVVSTPATRLPRRCSMSGCVCCGPPRIACSGSRLPAAVVQDNLRREASKRGVSPERLVFAPREPMAGYLARHRHADLFLDTLPYNAVGTAYHALLAGLPVLTCAGETFAGRTAGSMLLAAGLPELVTVSLEEYERLAIRLTQEADLLAGIRRRLARARSSAALFDAERAVRELETAYARMWETWLRGEAPKPFSVPRTTGP